MLKTFEFWFGVLVVVGAYLCVSIMLRVRAREADRWEREGDPATPIDVSAITPRIEKLRQDYVTAVHGQPRDTYYRTGLMATVRRMVGHHAYFSHAKTEQEMQGQDGGTNWQSER
jgi:hypothetical protein